MIEHTGLGSLPGTDFGQALRTAFELEFPYLPELPSRGPWAGMIGRGLGVASGLPAQYEAGQWRLAPTAGIDLRRARVTLRDDLDQLEETAAGFSGRCKTQVAGPWTLAASTMAQHTVRVLADPGARRDLGQALAAGVRDLLVEVKRRLPGAQLVLQIDEPSLPAVLAGAIATPGGFFRHRAIDLPEASDALALLTEVAHDEGAQAVVHCCAPGLPVAAMTGPAGFDGVSLDQDQFSAGDYEALAQTAEAGRQLWLGCLPTNDPSVLPSVDQLRQRVLGVVERIAVNDLAGRLVLTPACGLAGFPTQSVKEVFRRLGRAASQVSAELAE
ncbi:MAG: hypothetical protein LBK28_02280 [Propionibacteriaceae bacterium]|jgi:methionine synthase II (cobalamin-independent)|nr:hypothetical protein [Propionibacteriaceae bacterium]